MERLEYEDAIEGWNEGDRVGDGSQTLTFSPTQADGGGVSVDVHREAQLFQSSLRSLVRINS